MLSMDTGPIILDISSDDEEGTGNPWDKSSLDWISKLFEDPDEIPSDPDAVVVLDELSCAAARAPKLDTSSPIAKVDSGDASDDECMILDGDPDKPVAVVHDKEHESDELLIVGEKGDLACRDYPHPRHLCATFPFRSAPHNQHCNQCHCYVCDVVAPCARWGNGTSTGDHCHSTDKEEKWKMLRKSFKDGTASIANGRNLGNRDPIVAAALQNPITSTATSGYNPMLPAQRPVLMGPLRACSNSTFQSCNSVSQIPIQKSVDRSVQFQFHQLVSAPNAVRAGQGVSMQPANPVLANSRGVSCPRASFVHTGVSRAVHVAAHHSRLHRPIYRPHQSVRVVEPPRDVYLPPAQGSLRKHPTNLDSRKRQNALIQDPLKSQTEPVFKRMRIDHLPSASVQENQLPSEIPPLDAVGLKRLNDIMSGLVSDINACAANHTDHSSTTFVPSVILHPHVPVVSRHSAEILGCSDACVAPTPRDAYSPSYPSIGYNLSGSNLWSSSPAMTNMGSSGLDVSTAGNQPQNFEDQFLMESLTRDNEATSLPSLSNDPGLSIAGYSSNQWPPYIATRSP